MVSAAVVRRAADPIRRARRSAALAALAALLAGAAVAQSPQAEPDREEAATQPADRPLGQVQPPLEEPGDGAGVEPGEPDPRQPWRRRDDLGPAEGRGGLTFSLQLGAARDTGLRARGGLEPDPGIDADGEPGSPLADRGEHEDSLYVIVPSLLLHRRPSRRTEVVLAYQPEIERFEERDDLDATHHAAGVRLEHLASRRSRLVFGGSLLDGEDPSRHLGGQLLVLPRTPYSQSRIYAGFEHQWTSTGLLFYVGRTATEIEPTDLELAGPLLGTGIDESEYTATLTLDRTLGERSGFVASYSYVVPDWSSPAPGEDPLDPVDPLDPADPFDEALLPAAFDDPVHTATVGFTHRFAERVRFHVAGGVHYAEEATYLGSIGLAREGEAFSLGLRYERSLLAVGAFSSVGIGSPGFPTGPGASLRDAVSESLTATFAVRPIDRLRLEQHLWAARADLLPGDPLETLSSMSRLQIETVRRLGVFGQYEWFEQSGAPLLLDELSRSRFSAGLVIGLAGRPDTWGVRQDSTLLERVLPFWRND
jgi:hypothetical protein